MDSTMFLNKCVLQISSPYLILLWQIDANLSLSPTLGLPAGSRSIDLQLDQIITINKHRQSNADANCSGQRNSQYFSILFNTRYERPPVTKNNSQFTFHMQSQQSVEFEQSIRWVLLFLLQIEDKFIIIEFYLIFIYALSRIRFYYRRSYLPVLRICNPEQGCLTSKLFSALDVFLLSLCQFIKNNFKFK